MAIDFAPWRSYRALASWFQPGRFPLMLPTLLRQGEQNALSGNLGLHVTTAGCHVTSRRDRQLLHGATFRWGQGGRILCPHTHSAYCIEHNTQN